MLIMSDHLPSKVCLIKSLKGFYIGGIKRIAEYFEITEWAVRKWEKQIPAKRCKGLIELSNGKLTFAELRPDLFD